MHDADTRSQFIELRGRGWSLARIAGQLNVSQRTLVDWNQQDRDEIRTLRAVQIEALKEKILATHEHQLTCLQHELQRLEQELAKRTPQYISTENLYRLSALLRAEIRKVCQETSPPETSGASATEPK